MIKNERLDETLRQIGAELASGFEQFRFVIVAVDWTGVCNPVLTFDPRLCRHEVQRILERMAATLDRLPEGPPS
jgi:hypothetical protein